MTSSTGGLRAIFFDFDGTIAETERFGHRVAYNRAFADLGLDWVWDEELYGELLSVAGGRERLRYFLDRYHPTTRDATELIARIYPVKVAHFTAIAPAIPLRPGVSRLMREAHAAGVTVAIATTASQAAVHALLDSRDGLLDVVDLIAASDTVERKKPEPDVYLWTLERLGLRPEECVAIEDSNLGLRAARKASLRTLITVSDYTRFQNFSGAAAVVSSLGDTGDPMIALRGETPPNGVVDLAYLEHIRTQGPN